MLRATVIILLAIVMAFSPTTFGQSRAQVIANRSLSTLLPEVKFQGVTLKDSIDYLRDVTGANIHVNWKAIEATGVNGDTQVNIRLRDVPLRKVLNVLLAEAGGAGLLTYYSDEGVIEITTTDISDKQLITKVYPIEDLVMEIPDFDNAPDFSIQQNGGAGGGGGGRNGGGSRGGGGRSGGGRSGSGGGSSGGGGGLFGGGGGSGGGGGKTAEKTTTKTERAEALVTMVRETIRPEIWRENGGVASIRYYNGHMVVTAPRSVHEAIGGAID